jgi:hypothetical protein
MIQTRIGRKIMIFLAIVILAMIWAQTQGEPDDPGTDTDQPETVVQIRFTAKPVVSGKAVRIDIDAVIDRQEIHQDDKRDQHIISGATRERADIWADMYVRADSPAAGFLECRIYHRGKDVTYIAQVIKPGSHARCTAFGPRAPGQIPRERNDLG